MDIKINKDKGFLRFLDFIKDDINIENKKEDYKIYSSDYDSIESSYIRLELKGKDKYLEDIIDMIMYQISSKFCIYDRGLSINSYTMSLYFKDKLNHEQYIEFMNKIYNDILEAYNKNIIFEGDKISSLKRTSIQITYVHQIFNIYCLKNGLDFSKFYPKWNKNIVKFFPYEMSGYIQMTIKDDIVEIENGVSA